MFYLESSKLLGKFNTQSEALKAARDQKLEHFSILDSELESVYDEWPKINWV